MKLVIKIAAAACITTTFLFYSCKKEKDTVLPATNFLEIKLSHIQAKEFEMTSNKIVASDKNGVLWQVNDVYIFSTNENRYG